jgi:hypothetical protein
MQRNLVQQSFKGGVKSSVLERIFRNYVANMTPERKIYVSVQSCPHICCICWFNIHGLQNGGIKEIDGS